MRSALYHGTVMHARRTPSANVFRYPVYMSLIDLGELPALDRVLPLFGWNRRAVTSYHDADHVDIRHFLAASGVDTGEIARLQVLTNLRVLGYVFNPVSFWWAWRADGSLACAVGEVNNTFGERYPYLMLPADAVERNGRPAWETEKLLHVSPFMSMNQRYTWWLSEPGERVAARVDVHENGTQGFHATLSARRVELTPRSLRAALVRYPLMPLRVFGLIHLQAARLALRRTPFHSKPPFVAGQGTVKR